MTVISGRRCCALLAKQDPLSFLARTLLESSAWNSTRCFLIWRESATPQGRLLFQLAVSMPRTGEIGSGLWATPQERDYRTGEGHRWFNPEERSRNLNDQAAAGAGYKMWPTPTAKDHRDTGDCENVEENCLLGRAVGPTKASGLLNPEFVEYLMGFPRGFTDLKR